MRQLRAGGRGGGARRLSIDEEHSVVRCRLDFVTNRQLRKLRTLADLRLAAVSSLQVPPPPRTTSMLCWKQCNVWVAQGRGCGIIDVFKKRLRESQRGLCGTLAALCADAGAIH